MQRKRMALALIISLVAVGLICSTVLAKQKTIVKMVVKQDMVEYIIKSGDTLWDISNYYYGDPWLWPKIWEKNLYVSDPHWIYPNNKLNIPITEAYKEAIYKDAPYSDIPPVILFDPTFRYNIRNNQIDIISEEKLEGAGRIIYDIDELLILGEENYVYFTMDKKENVQIGDLFTIYRTERKIKHPKGGKVGYLANLVGEVKTIETNVLKNGKIVYTGHVIDSTSEIEPDDLIIPMSREELLITLKESSLDLSGYIVGAQWEKMTLGDYDVCYIDLGIKDGVKMGQSFSIYRKSPKPKKLPPYFIGNLIVMKVQDNNATCLISNSLREIEVGDMIKSDITTELE